MLTLLLSVLLQSAMSLPPAPGDGDPHRQFDFWVGEWSVQNRHINPDGSWRDGDVTRARIVPVCDGAAMLEEWAGNFRGTFMNGFSLRAYDPAQQGWKLLLSWTTNGNDGFGSMSGSFRHGRGEFSSTWTGSDGNPVTQRYTFSDGLADSVRWDSATTHDGGLSWKTDWIMEFSRTRPAVEVTQDVLFDEAWTTGSVSPHAAARDLDWMLGTWEGRQVDSATGAERAARLRSKLLNKDCIVLDVLQTRAEGSSDWDQRLAVRAYVSRKNAWEAWHVSEADTRLRQSNGLIEGEAAGFERTDPANAVTTREIIRRTGDDTLVIEESASSPGTSEFTLLRVTELTRVD